MDAVRSVLANLSPRGRLALAGAGVAMLVLAFLIFRFATQPSYATLTAGLDPADTGDITAALDKQGIGYEVRNNGTAVAVSKSDVAKARIALADEGVVGGSRPGFELFDKQQFGASDFQQKVTYQRALEGELARTISQVDGISGATVQLTLPEDQLFAAESIKPTAAVLLNSASGALEPAAVRGIARLVASSVERLDPADVTITDNNGVMLWPNGNADAGGNGVSTQAGEARYDRELEARLDGLLLRTIGPEKGRVQVKAELDLNRTTESSLSYARQGTPLDRSMENETLRGAPGTTGGGAAGSAGNIPTYGAVAASGGNSNYKRDTEHTQYGVDKTITHTQVAPGAVKRQAIALVVDKSVPVAEVRQLENAVATAAGIEPKRGDTISTSRIAFAAPPPSPGASPLGGILHALRYVALALATLAFLVFAGRHLRRRQEEVLDPEPIWLRELNAPASLAELKLAETRQRDWGVDHPALNGDEDAVEMEPERVAQQLRAWMKET